MTRSLKALHNSFPCLDNSTKMCNGTMRHLDLVLLRATVVHQCLAVCAVLHMTGSGCIFKQFGATRIADI